VISHPHFYTTHLEWAHQFNCPVYTSAADSKWLNRKDPYGLRKLIEGTTEISEGVTAIQCGGHFDGSLILHFDGVIFIADTMMSAPVRPVSFVSFTEPLSSNALVSSRINMNPLLTITQSGFYHKDRLPGTTSYSFMWSYPNMIPCKCSLSPAMSRILILSQCHRTRSTASGKPLSPSLSQLATAGSQVRTCEGRI
jgi:hypothetical protein